MATIFQDLFTESISTTLASHTPDTGTGWTALIQVGAGSTLSAYAVTNTARRETGGANDGVLYTADATYGTDNYEVSADFPDPDSGDDYCLLAARITDSDNLVLLEFNEDYFVLWKRVSGTWTQLGTNQGAVVSANDTVSLEVNGNTVKAKVNASVQITESISDVPGTNTKGGLGIGAIKTSSSDMSTQDIDNFIIETLPGLTFTIDGIVKEINTKTFTIDGHTVSRPTPTFTIDGIVSSPQTLDLTIDGMITSDRLLVLGMGLADVSAGTNVAEFDGVSNNGTPISISSSIFRSGNYSLRVQPNTTAQRFARAKFSKSTDDYQKVWVRVYFRVDTIPSVECRFISIGSGDNTHVLSFGLKTNGALQAYTDASTALGSSSPAIQTGKWHRLEFKIDNENDVYEARLDGVEFANESSVTFGTTESGSLFLGQNVHGYSSAVDGDYYFDDIVISGSGWPGTSKLTYLRPGSQGSFNDWWGTYQSVDEVPPNDDTDSIYDFDDNDKESFNLMARPAELVDDSIIKSVSLGWRVEAGSAHSEGVNEIAEIRPFILLSGSYLYGKIQQPLDTTWRTNRIADNGTMGPVLFAEKNPSGNTWTTDDIDNLEIGAEVVDGHNDAPDNDFAHITAIWMIVEYVSGKTFTIDGHVVNQFTDTFTIDGHVVTRVDETFTIDGEVKEVFTSTFTIDGIVLAIQTATFTIDGAVLELITKTFTIDGIVFGRNDLTFTLDGIVQVQGVELTFTIDGSVVETLTLTFTIDGIVSTQNTLSFTIDGLIGPFPYVLGDFILPRPKTFDRRFIDIGQEFLSINGRLTRDYTNRKEEYILRFEVLSQSELDDILSMLEGNAAVNLTLNDGDLQINQVPVFAFISSIEYSVPGSNYIASLVLRLVEVT